MQKRISASTVIACVALFFSLSGDGLAASRYLITSVSQIKPSVRLALRGPQGDPGETGPQGIAGVVGEAGPQGPAGLIDWSRTYTVRVFVGLPNDNTEAFAIAPCHPGDRILTGGVQSYHGVIVITEPTSTGWVASGHLDPAYPVVGDPTEITGTLEAIAVCVTS